MIKDIRTLFVRDLRKLCNEIDAFDAEIDLWRTMGTVSNSAGNLTLHICGNLRHFVGAVLGGSAYIRDREREFGATGIPKSDLLDEVNRTIASVEDALAQLDEQRLLQPYPIRVLPEETTTGYFLLHLYGHLNYHLGQVNYLRRLL
ncbi:MAG: DinB family protein [Flavobacteriales bacterium]|nr:DinB family protein [Flavobacteriales bacterium]